MLRQRASRGLEGGAREGAVAGYFIISTKASVFWSIRFCTAR